MNASNKEAGVDAMIKHLKIAALTIAAGTGLAATTPALAVELPGAARADVGVAEYKRDRDDRWSRGNDRRGDYRYSNSRRDDYRRDDRRYDNDRYRGERVRHDTRVWRGNDGRYYCRKEDGTTGLLIGAAVGGLVGNEVAGRGDKTLGVLLGAVVGGLAGREIDRSDSRCR
jgi:hypothetical protein